MPMILLFIGKPRIDLTKQWEKQFFKHTNWKSLVYIKILSLKRVYAAMSYKEVFCFHLIFYRQ